MAVSEAQKRASEKYRREKVKQFAVRFYPSEAGIWEHLQAQGNKAGYIKGLIEADMKEKGRSQPS